MSQVPQCWQEMPKKPSWKTVRTRDHIVNSSVVAELFVRFNTNWGGLWSSRFSSDELYDAALLEWCIDLEPYDQKCIDAAMMVCKKTFTKGPPTLGQFCDECKNAHQREVRQKQLMKRLRLPPPAKKTPEQIAFCREKLKNMMSIIKSGKPLDGECM